MAPQTQPLPWRSVGAVCGLACVCAALLLLGWAEPYEGVPAPWNARAGAAEVPAPVPIGTGSTPALAPQASPALSATRAQGEGASRAAHVLVLPPGACTLQQDAEGNTQGQCVLSSPAAAAGVQHSPFGAGAWRADPVRPQGPGISLGH